MLKSLIITIIILLLQNPCYADSEYFLTLRYDKVNLRQGPSREYPVKILHEEIFAGTNSR